MITEKEIFAEVKNTFKSYDDAGLLDEISMRTWLKSELKRFGNNVMVDTDEIVEVRGGKGKLPEDFWTLNEAWKYTPSHYCLNEGSEEELDKCSDWRQNYSHLPCNCEEDSNINVIKERYSYHTTNANIYYNNPTILRLAKTVNRNAITKGCINLSPTIQKKYRNTINIQGNYLNCEFTKGSVYILYKALPTDEEGNIVIPTTQHDALFKCLQRHLEYNILRDLMLNNDDPNLWNKIQWVKQEYDEAFALAYRESKAGIFSPSVWKNLKNKNRARYRKYERLTPKLNF